MADPLFRALVILSVKRVIITVLGIERSRGDTKDMAQAVEPSKRSSDNVQSPPGGSDTTSASYSFSSSTLAPVPYEELITTLLYRIIYPRKLSQAH